MRTLTYETRRGEIETYFDRTAVEAWKRLTSNAPVSRIRATVRAGRDRMRATLLSWLPADLAGLRVLDAGCGTGALALAAAARGAEVVAIDLSPTLVALARERALADPATHEAATRVQFLAGDMLDERLGSFDHVVAMDSLIHYETADMLRALGALAPRVRGSMAVTYAPRTPLLAAMHAVGQVFPRSDRSPAIVPVAPQRLARALDESAALLDWRAARSERVACGFYTSQALELVRR